VLSQDIVNSVKSLADELGARGNLALIAVGSQVDPLRKYIPQLTDSYFFWIDPKKAAAPSGWEEFFWHQAYGCDGNPPRPGTVPTITMPSNQLN
jgi:hypothetical protein